jgi:hypothetical protein
MSDWVLVRQNQAGRIRLGQGGTTGDKELQGAGDDLEFDGEAGEGLAVDLGVDGILVERFANDGVGFVEVDPFGAAKIAHPERGQVAQIAEATLRGESHDFELVFEEIGVGGDLEGAAVIFGAANDGKGDVELLIADAKAEMLEIVTKDFAGAFPPVGQYADAGFQVEVEGIDDHAVGSGAADAEKIFLLSGIFEGSRQAEGNFFHRAANELFGGAGNVPGEIQFLGEDVGGTSGKKGERDAVAVLVGGEAVDDFVESAVAAAGDDQAAAFGGSALCNFRGVARAGGLRKFGFDATSGKNMASRIKRAAAAVASAAGVGIVNQQSVSKIRSHRWFKATPFVPQDIHSI